MNNEPQVEADIEIDGKGFNYTGEVRRVKQGEYFQDRDGDVVQWYTSYPSLARYPILVPVEEWSKWETIRCYVSGSDVQFKVDVEPTGINIMRREKK